MSTTTTTSKIRKDRATQLDEDFGFHEKTEKKWQNCRSRESATCYSNIITHLNGKTLEDLTPTELTALFSTRTVLLRPTIPERETPNVIPIFLVSQAQIVKI